jgi:formylglycine-generating enzyme required for sulfatase activity/serine/threonine protein kinase
VPQSLAEFQTQLSQSGLLSAEDVESVVGSLAGERAPRDAESLARELVRHKKLTAFQAQQLYQGRGKHLVLGNYVVLDKLGQGGMGLVLKAQHRRMKRVVALKVLSPAVTKNPDALRRFQREVEAAARLEHPHIVTAHDADEAGGTHFLVMQYVDGTDLAAHVRQHGPLPVEQALNCILQAARGLEYAHGQGVVHRDIKPGNLLLDRQGTVKILDMGLARLEAAGAGQDELTGTGQIMGTVDYMAPEQAMSTRSADARADIYSLGVTLWYLLTGRALYDGETPLAKLMAHQQRPIPVLREVCPAAPAELEAVFSRMVAKTPGERFQTMTDAIAALERSSGSQPAAAPAAAGPAEDAGLSDFLRGMAASASGSRAGAQPALAARPQTAAPVDQTMALSAPTVDTDPKTEQSLPSALVGVGQARPDGRLMRRGRETRAERSRRWRASIAAWWQRLPVPPRWRVPALVACGLAAAGLLLAGILLYLDTEQGTVRIEINDPEIEVKIDGQEATILWPRPHVLQLEPGPHGLRIKYGELEFNTDKFVLADGDTVTLKVELLPERIEVRQGEQVLGSAPLRPADSIASGVAWHGWPADAPAPAIAPFDAAQARKHQEEWAAYLKLPVEYENSIGMKFVLIPPGEFTMGSTAEEIEAAIVGAAADEHWRNCIRSEAPRHKVILTQPIYLGVHEVTQAQYNVVMGTTPSHFAATGAGKDAVDGIDTTSHPVEQVSWNDAAEFCDKLSETEELKPFYFRSGETVTVLDGTGYRLPTEAEWEFACRAGTTTKYWPGDRDEDLTAAGWFGSNSGGRTHAVGELKANPLGLYDIQGNVWEWAQDWWEPTHYGQFQETPALDPSGPSSAGSQRVFRGGDWFGYASYCRASSRLAHDPTYRHAGLGFRVALAADTVKAALAESAAPPESATTAWHGWPADAPAPAIAPFDAAQARQHQEDWAAYLGVPVEWENSIGMKFALIPPGEFQMGSMAAEIDTALVAAGTNETWKNFIRSEAPRHSVVLTQPIYLGIHEVTQAQYEQVMGTNPSHIAATGPSKDAVANVDTQKFPVETVSWNDAAEFCAKLSEKEELNPFYSRSGETATMLDGNGYRLPTEAEWEFACRAGTTTRFWIGDQDDSLVQAGWSGANSGGRTHAAGELKANPLGLFDVHGNVWEWVQDWGDFSRQFAETPAIDPSGPSSAGLQRVIRGGDWRPSPSYCRSSTRYAYSPTARHDNVGFRAVLAVEAVKSAIAKRTAPQADPTSSWHGWPADAPAPAIAPFDAAQARKHQEEWADYVGVPVEWENSIGMKFVLIPPGEFLMGSTPEEIEAALVAASFDENWMEFVPTEAPRHTVILTQPIFLGVHEVTQKEYQQVMGTNPSHFAASGAGQDAVGGLDTSTHPVEVVSWLDAAEFCAKLSEREEFKPGYSRSGETVTMRESNGYRLPTEAQWEFACRAGSTTRFWSGDQDENLVQAGWYDANAGGRTHSVGELNGNPLGLLDIHGNVWEWVEDGWEATYYGQFQDKSAIDPRGPSPADSQRVIRGGGCAFNASMCRASLRAARDPPDRNGNIGFRVALSVEAVKAAIASATNGAGFALEFDGEDDYVELPIIDFDLQSPLTVEAWFTALAGDKPGAADVEAQTDALIAARNPATGMGYGLIVDRPKAAWWFGINDRRYTHSVFYWFERSEMRTDLYDTRHHAALVWDTREVRMYVDGKPQHSGGGTADGDQMPPDPTWHPSQLDKFHLGAGATSLDGLTLTRFFHGTIEGVHISRAARYAEDFAPPARFAADADTLALYDFGEGQGDMLHDSSGHGHDGRIVGAKWVPIAAAEGDGP